MIAKLKREKVHIAFWQETHLSNAEHEKLKKFGFSNTFYSSHKSGNKRGVAILISNRVHFELISVTQDKEGRFTLVKGKIEGKQVTLFNIYAPPGSPMSFFKKVFDLLALEKHGPMICAGDFNLLMNPTLDTTNKKRKKNPTEIWMNKTIKLLGLTDVWRELHGRDKDYTFYSARHNMYSRIDYCFMFKSELHRVKYCKIGQRDLSDHADLFLKLHLDEGTKKTNWRLNVSMLNNEGDKKAIIEDYKVFLSINDNGEVSPPILWDTAKAYLRGKLIAKAAFLKKTKSERLHNLENRLKMLEQLHSQKKDPLLLTQMQPIKQEIDQIYCENIEKNIRYMKQRYYEAGPKAAKVLAWRLRKQQEERTIHKIRDPITNKLKTKLKNIHCSFEKYYTLLYTQKGETNTDKIDKFLYSLDLPSLGKKHNDILTAQISDLEINKAISSLKASKSPGTDGYPAEWYKVMREPLLPLLKECFNSIMNGGPPPPSWKEAFISVIHKEGKNKLECKSYRPISVLNVDYKLFASILARRMEEAMSFLIDVDQTGFIKDRQTHDNIRRTIHIIDYISKTKLSAVLLSLDAEKAFDSVSWPFLYQTMGHFGFSEQFIQCIRAL